MTELELIKAAKQGEINTKSLERKADQSVVSMLEKQTMTIQSTLVRIENKLDDYIKDGR